MNWNPLSIQLEYENLFLYSLQSWHFITSLHISPLAFASELGLMWFCSHPSPGIYQTLVRRQLMSETSFKANDTTLWAGRKGTFTVSAHWGTWIKCIILQLYLQNNKLLPIPSNRIYKEVQSKPRWKSLVLDLWGIRAIRNMTWPPAFYQFSTLMLLCVKKA